MSSGRPGESVTGAVAGLRDVEPRRVPEGAAFVGAVGWLLAAPVLEHVVRLFLLAPLVLVPLGLSLTATPTRSGDHALVYRLAVALQLPAAALVVGSLLLASGALAGALVVPWLATTMLIAGFGAWRSTERGLRPLPETAIDAGLLYLPVGAAWLLAHRLDLAVLGFEGAIVLFTAVHFHYAGFVVPVAVGVGGRVIDGRRRRGYTVTAPVAIAGPAVIAAGIAASPLVEVLAVVAYTVAVVGLVATLAAGTRGRQPVVVAGLAVAAVAVAGSMAFAFAHGVTTVVDAPFGLSNARMVALHGSLNAVFAICVLGALGVADPDPTAETPVPGVPYSRLRSRGRVGTDFFERRGLVDDDRSVEGMVDDLAGLERPGFDPAAVAPVVRAVYERSAATDLRLQATWRRGVRRPSRLLSRLGGAIEQLHLPAHGAVVEGLESAVVPITEPGEGRPDARAWIRWYADTGRAMYVASYETHCHDGIRYLNVAFPLPGGNLAGVLRPGNDGDGLVLSSHRDGGDDAGLYLGTPVGPVRLPLAERLRLHPDGDGGVDAVHEVDVFGRRLVTLSYDIDILEGPADEAETGTP